MKKLVFGAITFLCVGGYVACGGDQGSSATGSNDGGGASGEGGAEGGGLDGGSGSDGGVTDAGQNDGAPTLSTDGGSGDDGGPGGNTAQITCGSATCAIPSGTCCVYPNANTPPPPAFYFSCSSGACPPPAAGIDPASALKCSLAANCPPSTVCCITSDGVANNISSQCKPTCTAAAGATTATLCDPTMPGVGCQGATTCTRTNVDSWNIPNGFGTCGGVKNPN